MKFGLYLNQNQNNPTRNSSQRDEKQTD